MRKMSEQLLLAKRASLVMDGLILWIDGRDAPLSGGSLTDRVTNTVKHRLTPYGGTVTVAQTEDGLYTQIQIPGDTWFGRRDSDFSAEEAAGTVEIVVGGSGNGFSAFTRLNSDYRGHIGMSNDVVRYYWGDSDNTYDTIQTDRRASHIVARSGVITIDGQNYTNLRMQFNTVSFHIPLIMRNKYGATATIGAIRAYNRVLSDDEILQNLAYEKSIGRINV